MLLNQISIEEINCLIMEIKETNLFKRMEDADFQQMLASTSVETFSKKVLSSQEVNANKKLYVILKGRVKCFHYDPNKDKKCTIYLLTEGDIFDILTFLDGESHSIDRECIEDVTLLSIPIDKARDWIKEYPAFSISLLPYISERMRKMEETIADFSIFSTLERLVKLLVNNITKENGENSLIKDLTDKEIAELIGTTRSVVNRHLQDLKKQGLIASDRKNIIIKDLKNLVKIIESI